MSAVCVGCVFVSCVCCSFFPADLVTGSMLASGHLKAGLQEKVKAAMLRRHHHQNEKRLSSRIPLVRSFTDADKRRSDAQLLDGKTLISLRSSREMSHCHGCICGDSLIS